MSAALKIAVEQMVEDLTELVGEIAYCNSYAEHYASDSTVLTEADREIGIQFWTAEADEAVHQFVDLWAPYLDAAGYAA